MQAQLQQLSIHCLQAGLYQPRLNFNQDALEELAQSIRSQGLIEPLVVRPITQERYEIIAGERRWRAAKLAGLETIACLVGQYTDKQAATLTLVENIQRQELNLIEEASGYKRLIEEFHYLQEEIAVLVGKSRSHIANMLRLLSLGFEVKQMLCDQLLSFGHARVLVGLSSKEQEFFARQVVEEQWSVRQLEQAVKQFKSKEEAPKDFKKDKDVERLQMILSEQLGYPVEIINDEAQGGCLKLKFFDNDTLSGLLERLGLRYD